ncbi:MAG: GNAT family N-acetyltransferase [Bacillota bacterium]|nr:GNAT family N-acetyltransferase [Bacillota bacterium]
MIIRKIRREELPEFERVRSVAYNFTPPDAGDRALLEHFDSLFPDAAGRVAALDRCYASFTDDGWMTGVAIAGQFQAGFLGELVGVGGVGGVASYPEHRRGGGVRGILEEMLRRFAADGCVFAALYPFRHLFYRKFGFEVIQNCRRYTLRPADIILRVPPLEGSWTMLRPAELGGLEADFADWRRLEDRMWRHFDGFFEQHMDITARLEQDNPFTTKHYHYLMHDAKGEPRTALSFRSDQRRMVVRDLLFTSAVELAAVLQFLQRFAADIDEVELELPPGYAFSLLIEDTPAPAACTAMLRVIDAEAFLGLLSRRWHGTHPGHRLPAGLAVAVQDRQLPANEACFLLTPDGVCRGMAAPESTLSLDICELSALASGDLRVFDLGLTRTAGCPAVLAEPERAAALAEVFADRRWYMRTYF